MKKESEPYHKSCFAGDMASFHVFSVVGAVHHDLQIQMIFGIRIDISEKAVCVKQCGVILVGPLVVLRVVDSFKIRRGAVAVSDMAAHKMDNDKVIFVLGSCFTKSSS